MFTDLTTLRDALADIDEVHSCKVGIEAGISPADWPLIRIVPIRMIPKAYHERTVELEIYFGFDLAESEGLENVYQHTLEMEAEIIKTIKAQGGKYIETVTDEDRIDTYKMMRIRADIDVDRPIVT